MTLSKSDLIEVLESIKAGGEVDLIRRGAEMLYQALIEAEVTEQIRAGRFERSRDRVTQRNGHRSRLLTTKAGDLEFKIHKLREGSFFPSLLERCRRIDRALFAVVMEAYVHGVSTRKVDDLVGALGVDAGVSKSEVSRISAQFDAEITAFRERTFGAVAFPFVFHDATYLKGRVNHQVVSRAVVVGTGVSMDGRREVLGLRVGDSEDGAFWTEFLRSLKARGLAGVRLVISDQHPGLKKAVETVMVGSSWQRCRVRYVDNRIMSSCRRTPLILPRQLGWAARRSSHNPEAVVRLKIPLQVQFTGGGSYGWKFITGQDYGSARSVGELRADVTGGISTGTTLPGVTRRSVT